VGDPFGLPGSESSVRFVVFLLFFPHLQILSHCTILLVVEPDHLPDSEVFYFQPCLYPMKYLHPKSMYTLAREGVQRGGTPSAGSGGAISPAGGSGGKRAPSGGSGVKPPKEKLPCKNIM
jgi:hypothetical protein